MQRFLIGFIWTTAIVVAAVTVDKMLGASDAIVGKLSGRG